MFEFYQSQNLVSQYLKLIYHRGENPQHGSEIEERGEGLHSTGYFDKHNLVMTRVHRFIPPVPTH